MPKDAGSPQGSDLFPHQRNDLRVSRTGSRDGYLENALTLFTTLSIWAAWHAARGRPVFYALTGIGVACAVLIKGPVALFPLGAVVVFAIADERPFFQVALRTCLVASAALLVLALIWTLPQARTHLLAYLDNQLLATFTGERPPVHGRGYLIIELARNLGIGAVCAGAIIVCRSRATFHFRPSIRWWVIAACASLPLLLSPRQFRHYLFPALPLFAIAIAAVIPTTPWRFSISTRAICIAGAIAAIGGGLMFWQRFGAIGSDRNEIALAAAIDAALPSGTHAYICPRDADRYQVLAYLHRDHRRTSRITEDAEQVLCSTELPGRFIWRRIDDDLALWRRPSTGGTPIDQRVARLPADLRDARLTKTIGGLLTEPEWRL